jgi:uncharacterized protein (DUF58 family)
VSEPAGSDARVGLGSRLFAWLLPSVLLPLALPPEQRALAVAAYDALILLAFVLDARRLTRADLALRREAPRCSELGRPLSYTLVLENGSRDTLSVRLADDGEPETPSLGAGSLHLAPGTELSLHGSVLPRMRGVFTLGPAHAHLESRLGLARIARRLDAGQALNVLPAPSAPECLSPSTRRALGDLARGRSRGPRSPELAGCRALTPGDPPNTLDARKTARHGRPIVRTYEREHDDPLWLVLDTGRSMLRASDDPARPALLERAIQATLAVARATLSEGRAVGFVAFDAALGTLALPARGAARFGALRDRLARLHASTAPFDPDALYEALAPKLAGRCQVVLITALHADALIEPLARLSRALTRRHGLDVLVVGDALLRAGEHDDVYLRAARRDLAAAEAARLRTLGRAGASVLYFEDVPGPTPPRAAAEHP